MTKADFLKDIKSHEEWLKGHTKYVSEALAEMRPYFDVDRFIADTQGMANRTVVENILADTQMNFNYDLGEVENNLARLFSMPYEKIVEYRTEQFWKEIATA